MRAGTPFALEPHAYQCKTRKNFQRISIGGLCRHALLLRQRNVCADEFSATPGFLRPYQVCSATRQCDAPPAFPSCDRSGVISPDGIGQPPHSLWVGQSPGVSLHYRPSVGQVLFRLAYPCQQDTNTRKGEWALCDFRSCIANPAHVWRRGSATPGHHVPCGGDDMHASVISGHRSARVNR